MTLKALLPIPLALAAMVLAATILSDPVASEAAASPAPIPRSGVWTVMNRVEATVCENYAVVNVIADIANRGPDPEFPFRVEVPDDALVTGLTIERDGVRHEARVEAREAAREEYEATKERQATGGLVERQRHSSVYAFLVNVAEAESVRATLTYERYLAAEEDEFALDLAAPVSGFGEDLGASFDVRICHSDGVAGARTEPATSVERASALEVRATYAVPPRHGDAPTPFRVAYTLDPTADAGSVIGDVHDGVGYFAHRFRAPPDARLMPLDLVLVLDVSGSMSGLKMTQMQDAAAQIVGGLRDEDRLHVVLFSTSASSAWPGLAAADAAQRREAQEVVREAFAGGGTNIGDGLARGFEAFDAVRALGCDGEPCERMPLLVFLTDGRATEGKTDAQSIRALARAANEAEAAVFALAFGADADWGLVAALAEDGAGRALLVPEGDGAEVDLRRFMAALTTPVLKDVRVHYDQAVKAHRATAPVLFAGSETLVVGTFPADARRLSGRVSATAPDGPREYAFDAPLLEGDASFLPRLVAYHEVLELERRIDAEGERAEWADRVLELALRFGFVTDYTSLVLALPESALAADERCADCLQVVAADVAESAASGSPSRRLAPRASSAPGSSHDASPGPAPAPSSGHAAGVPGPGAALAAAGVALAAAAVGRRRRG